MSRRHTTIIDWCSPLDSWMFPHGQMLEHKHAPTTYEICADVPRKPE